MSTMTANFSTAKQLNLLSDKIDQERRTQTTPAIPLDTPNWQLNQIISRANNAIDLKVVAIESAVSIMKNPEDLRAYVAGITADIKQLTAESRAAAAVMRSKSRNGSVARFAPTNPAPTGGPATPPVPTRKLDEFGDAK